MHEIYIYIYIREKETEREKAPKQSLQQPLQHSLQIYRDSQKYRHLRELRRARPLETRLSESLAAQQNRLN